MIAGLLKDNGIVTFKQLAGTDIAKLRHILDGAGLGMADPTSWPKQAGLAAEGKWTELEALQKTLKGGR